MKRLQLALLTGSIIALSGLTSCAGPLDDSQTESAVAEPSIEIGTAADSAIAPDTVARAPESTVQETVDSSNPTAKAQVSRRPQLIKKANLSLDVDSVEESFNKVREIVNMQQGDVLSLNDRGSSQADDLKKDRRRIEFEMRVPRQNLDATLDALTELGTVRGRTITTEDVSAQLVDVQARINNSRKSEAALQEIMSRSGEIDDVLEVSRELGEVRQDIERMSAQQKSWQTQVRYSTISLTLESIVAVSATQEEPTFSSQISGSWKSATSSVGGFTTDLLQLGIWLLAYSPYLAAILCGAAIARQATRPSS